MVARIRHDAPARAVPMHSHGLLADAHRPDIIRRNAGHSIKSIGQNAVADIRRLHLRPTPTIPVQGERSIWRGISLADRPDVVRRNSSDTVKAIANGAGIRAWH